MTAGDNRVTARATRMKSGKAGRRRAVGSLRGMLGALEKLGYDTEALLAEAGLSRADLADPDSTIPFPLCSKIFSSAQEQHLQKNLPLRLALETPAASTPLLEYLIETADSVGDALQRLARYLRIVKPAIEIQFDDEDDPIRVIVASPGNPFETEFTVAFSVTRLRRETECRFRATYAAFSHQPDDVGEFARVLECPVRLHASWDGWAVSRAAWQLPMRRRDPALRNWLERQTARILEGPPFTDGTSMKVGLSFMDGWAEGDMRIQIVAARLSTTPRTLQRQLAAEGTSFNDLRYTARRRAAEAFLSDATLTIPEIAYLLGYSEPAAFHRAFRVWHGVTPQVFRAQQRAPASAVSPAV